ncbi:MAG: carboxymuconolactone decarboxylase family protein [Pseudoxanthomonas sp.]
MPRITLPDPAQMDADQRAVYDRIINGKRGKIQGPLRAALHNAELASRWSALGELLRYNTSLTPRQSELAILVTGRACNSPFEWYAHRLEGEKAGLSADILDALLAREIPAGLDDTEHAIVCFARELNAANSVGDATYGRTRALLGDKAIVELTALVGYYTMVAMTLNAHEIPMPDGVTPAFELPQRSGL